MYKTGLLEKVVNIVGMKKQPVQSNSSDFWSESISNRYLDFILPSQES